MSSQCTVPPVPDQKRPGILTSGDALAFGALAGVGSAFGLWAWRRIGEVNHVAADDPMWPVEHPFLTGLIVAIVIAIAVRLYLFMQRMENR
jgi:hypothetical protein